jgi:hypothetical protein
MSSSDRVDLLEELAEALRTAIDQEQDYSHVTTVCETLLKADDEGGDPLQAVLLEIYLKALLHQSQHAKVTTCTTGNKSKSESVHDLQAYAYYRLEQYEMALQTARQSDGVVASLIQAQALYHLNQTQQALQVYQSLLSDDLLQVEVCTNIMAILTANATLYVYEAASNTNTNSSDSDVSDQARLVLNNAASQEQDQEYPYDLAFNLATYDFIKGNTVAKRHEALTLLQRAHRQCILQNGKDTQEVDPMVINATWGRAVWGEPTIAAATSKKTNAVGSTPKVLALVELVNSLQHKQQQANNITTNKVLLQALESLLTLKLSALQQRLCRYNLAVAQLTAQQFSACRATVQTLLQTMTTTGNSKTKKKTAVAANALPTAWENDTVWWQVRIEVLVAYSYLSQQQQGDKGDNNNTSSNKELEDAMDKVQRRFEKLSDSSNTLDDATLVYLQLHLQQLEALHKGMVFDSEQQIQWLQQLSHDKPHPAILATLAKIFQDCHQPEKATELLLKLQGGDSSGNQILAERAMAQEHYEDAVELYESLLSQQPQNQVARARLVEALSHVDPARAMEEWNKLQKASQSWQEEGDDEEEDGQELELRELPRIKHYHHDSIANASATTDDASNGPPPKSRAAVLRRRAKKREEHLATLQLKGLYNPAKPTMPDSERWVPKFERQRNRRRNKNQQHKGAQGGISQKDAAKLDVAARAANANNNSAAGGPSTSHLTVAGGPRKGGGRRR